jgi:isopenicillin N synthase-like dioxygenase
MAFHVPAIDIGPYVEPTRGAEARTAHPARAANAARADVAEALDEACRTVGFVQVTGHGVPDDVEAGLAHAMDDFFGLPLEVKSAYRAAPAINRGYTPPRTESLSRSLGLVPAGRMNDFFEAFNVGVTADDHPGLGLPTDIYAGNVWPDVPGFASRVDAYRGHAERVARTMTRIFADALGVAPDFFAGFTDHSADVLRMNNYALPPGEVDLDGELVGMSEHTDYGIVTVLWADREPGLQVLGPDGAWHDVMPDDGALLINLGDLTARWTNERWVSTVHRVVPPLVNGTVRRRRSAAYFHDGNHDALIETIGTCVPAGTLPLYPPVTVATHVAAKLAGSRAGAPSPVGGREAARVMAAR